MIYDLKVDIAFIIEQTQKHPATSKTLRGRRRQIEKEGRKTRRRVLLT